MRSVGYILGVVLLLCSCILLEEPLDPIQGKITGATVVTNPIKSTGKKNVIAHIDVGLDSLHLFFSDSLFAKVKTVPILDSGRFVFDSLGFSTYDIVAFDSSGYGVLYKEIYLDAENPDYHIDKLEISAIWYGKLKIDTSIYTKVIYYGRELGMGRSGKFEFPLLKDSRTDEKHAAAKVILVNKKGEHEYHYIARGKDEVFRVVDEEVAQKLNENDSLEIIKVQGAKLSCELKGFNNSLCFQGDVTYTGGDIGRDTLYSDYDYIDVIEGFDYSWGHDYELLAKKTSAMEGDAETERYSSIVIRTNRLMSYKLVKVLASQRSDFDNVEFYLKTLPIEEVNGDYYVDGYKFTCEPTVACNEMFYLLGLDYKIEVKFRHLDDSTSNMIVGNWGNLFQVEALDPVEILPRDSSDVTLHMHDMPFPRNYVGDEKISDASAKHKLNKVAYSVSSFRQYDNDEYNEYFPNRGLEYEIYEDLREISLSDTSGKELLLEHGYNPATVGFVNSAELSIGLIYGGNRICINELFEAFKNIEGYEDYGVGFREVVSLNNEGLLTLKIDFNYPIYLDQFINYLSVDVGLDIKNVIPKGFSKVGSDSVETVVSDNSVYYKFTKTGCPADCSLQRVWEYSLDHDNNVTKISESGDDISEILEVNQ